MSNAELILSLDIGTSSLKSALFDLRGRRLEKTTSHQAYALKVSHDGTAELAADDLEQAALRAIKSTLLVRKQSRELRDHPIAAVSASCFWHSLLGYNSRSLRSTPIYTWADARCREDAAHLRSRHSEVDYHARTGCMLQTSYWPAKLRWLERTGVAHDVTTWMSPAEWLYGRLCGAATMSLSMASGTGLLDLRRGTWDPALLPLAHVRSGSMLKISDEPSRVVTENPLLPPLHRFPELKDALWYPAIGDGAASNLGSDAVGSRTAAMNVGTSAALRLVAKKIPAKLPLGLFCYRVDAERCLLGGAISNAGNLRAWAVNQLRLPGQPAALEKALAKRHRPDHGLTVLPFWTGERSPSWPQVVGGTIAGITYATTALDLLQALVESSYHRLAQIADLIDRRSGGLDIVVSGGIRHSPESLRRLSNVLGRPIRICAEPEASLRGAAVAVLEKMGAKIKPLPRGHLLRPDQAAAKLYAEVRAAQIALEERTTDMFSTHRHPVIRRKMKRAKR